MSRLLQLIKLMKTEKKEIAGAAFFGLAASLASVGLMAAAAYLISAAALHPPLYTLTLTILAVRFFGLTRAVTKYLERYLSHGAALAILSRIRVFFYEKIEQLAPAIFNTNKKGDLLSRVTSDVESLQYFFLRSLYPPLVMGLVFFSVIYFLHLFSMEAAFILLAGAAVGGAIVPLVLTYLYRGSLSRLRETQGELSGVLAEFLFGFIELKTNNRLAAAVGQIINKSGKLVQKQKQQAFLLGIGESLLAAVSYLTGWFILVIGIRLVEAGALPGIYLALIVLAGLTVFEAAAPMASLPGHLNESTEAAARLFSLTLAARAKSTARVIHLPNFNLEINNLSFAYPGEANKALKNFKMSLPQGKKIAIIGPSGSGKSSVVNLLLKFYEFYEGTICIGGSDFKSFDPETVRHYFGLVAQDNHLFNDTVRFNLQLAKPGADDQELLRTLEEVQLDYVSLDYLVGERGSALSGGEKQRLAVARVILKNAPILLLDEPTTGLDPVTERDILNLLWALNKNKSVVYISHGLRGLDEMDEIIVLNQGETVETGSVNDLIKKKGYFFQLREIEKLLLLSQQRDSFRQYPNGTVMIG
ncbi:MAG: thiol reductant ABC exporter subunit CydC [Bacillota bacterium]